METLIKKTDKGYSLTVSDCNTEYNLNGITSDELKALREQINEILKKPKSKVMVWNPRSRKHDIIEQ